VALAALHRGVANRREYQGAERADCGDRGEDQADRVQRGYRAEGAGADGIQRRDQPDTERPGDPLPRIE
jgi:hypothetical protein